MTTPMLLGATAVSIIVLIGFSIVSWAVLWGEIPQSKNEIAMFICGAWATLATGVVGFWIGSSVGSLQKNKFFEKTP